MNTYEAIALIAEPDAEKRLESIQRLAHDALLPKPGAPIPKVTDFEKALTVGGGQTALLVDGHHKVLIDDGTVYKLYNSLPKAPVPKSAIHATTFTTRPNGIFHLKTSSGDIVAIPEKMIVEMYSLLPQPAPVPTVKQPDYEALITMLDQFSIGIGSDVSPSELRREYKLWKKQNM